MFNIVLYEPEIAPNTGNIIRLCANADAQLHLIEPLGFSPDEKKLRRAGLDYADWERIQMHLDFAAFLKTEKPVRLFTLSTHSETRYSDAAFQADDYFLFGPETRGLPAQVRDQVAESRRLTLPMAPNNRSLNLSNTVAIVLYEAWRQLKFSGCA
ncbi:MAG: tRNA (cytidine(34)-2'-O)-methyltransferase [Gammaproteobacteria bacterium]|nr:tRNA (cytidine(34)-2'-O)-methyltransferase [Gammaproteobacteria bacterium]